MQAALLLIALMLGPENPPELGAVAWQRKLEPALETASRTHRPVLLLFQEIPG